MTALLLRVTRARPHELPAALLAFAYFFALLAGYYVLRPIRDEMAIQAGQAALSSMFTAVFVAMLVLVPAFGALTARFPRRKLLPWLYAFFVANLVLFHAAFDPAGTQARAVAQAFFVWVSVFNLFAVSVFWSFMADLFDTAQAKRLYGFVAAGGTAGALAGPSLTALLVTLVGTKGMLLVSAGFLCAAIAAIAGLARWAERHPRAARDDDPHVPIGGSVWGGVRDIVRSPILIAIALFLFGYSLLSTFLYFQQAELVPRFVADSAERTRLLALTDLAVNVLTLAIQLAAFGAMIRRLGTGFMLGVMPAIAIAGFAALALAPALVTLLAFGIVRRAGEYAISKPARETLFNALTPEEKYKAKNVIDTLVHRTGDTASSWIYSGLKSLGLSMTGISWLSVPVAAAWLGVALWLGRAQRGRDAAAASVAA